MFSSISVTQHWVTLLIGAAMLAVQLWAFVDCALTRPAAFVAADKRTKPVWLVVTAIAALIGFVSLFNPLNLFSLIAIVGAGVYLADVRPAVRAVRGGGRPGSMGPYGPW